jgi:hypothetical protein
MRVTEIVILVACEESQAVTIELRKLGHIAYSCDVQDCSGGCPEWHVKDDVSKIVEGNCSFKTVTEDTHSVAHWGNYSPKSIQEIPQSTFKRAFLMLF